MSPTAASGPTLSRFWVAVWGTWPALHAVSAIGLRSRTPTVAARSARFTAVDLQGRAGHRRSMARVAPSLTPTPGWPPGGEAVLQDPAVERVVPGTPRRPGRDPALASFPERAPGTRRWCFADQLGPHFLDDPDQPVVLIESRAVLRRRRFHRQKAHLVLSALRHRAVELGDRADFHQVDTYAQALDTYREPLSVCAPTTWSSRDYVLGRPDLQVLAARGFVSTQGEFARWAEGRGRRRLLMEDFYRDARRRLGVLMDGVEPVGGRWNLDEENREPPPADGRSPAPEPWWPEEDEIDEQVRADLDRWEAAGEMSFVGDDGPRLFPVTREESLRRLEDFLEHRLGAFGPHEDAMLAGERWLAHSLLSPSLNLGLLDPLDDVVVAAERTYREG